MWCLVARVLFLHSLSILYVQCAFVVFWDFLVRSPHLHTYTMWCVRDFPCVLFFPFARFYARTNTIIRSLKLSDFFSASFVFIFFTQNVLPLCGCIGNTYHTMCARTTYIIIHLFFFFKMLFLFHVRIIQKKRANQNLSEATT